MSDYLWHYSVSKEAYLSQDDKGRWTVVGVRGNVIHTSPTKADARRWATEHGYKV